MLLSVVREYRQAVSRPSHPDRWRQGGPPGLGHTWGYTSCISTILSYSHSPTSSHSPDHDGLLVSSPADSADTDHDDPLVYSPTDTDHDDPLVYSPTDTDHDGPLVYSPTDTDHDDPLVYSHRETEHDDPF